MKKITITLLLVISTGIAFGQKKQKDTTSNSFDAMQSSSGLSYEILPLYYSHHIARYDSGRLEWIATVVKDTMTIEAPKVKYIKIDGVLFEIVRKTELRKYEAPTWSIFGESSSSPIEYFKLNK